MWYTEGGPCSGYHVRRANDENTYTYFNMWDAINKRNALNHKGGN